MLFVATAMFEYAILLAIKFGKQNRFTPLVSPGDEESKEEKCCFIDLYALRGFIFAYALTVSTYFSVTFYFKK